MQFQRYTICFREFVIAVGFEKGEISKCKYRWWSETLPAISISCRAELEFSMVLIANLSVQNY